MIQDAVKAFNVPAIEMPGFEADDIIATYATQARAKGWQVTIVSSDKDLMQLVDDKVTMLDTMKNKRVDVAGVHEKFGVGPERVIDVQALAGDSADNVPGVLGIGIKTAALLINEYGDLDTLLERAGEIKQNARREKLLENKDLAIISRELVTLKCDVPLEETLDDLGVTTIDAPTVMTFLDSQGFKSLKVKVLSHINGGASVHSGTQVPHVGDHDVKGDGPSPSQTVDVSLADQELAKELVVEKREYENVDTMDALTKWIEAIKAKGTVAVDTETTSINAMKAKMVGISLSIEAGKACYIPLRHVGESDGAFDFGDGENIQQIPLEKVIAALKPILEDPAILKVGQNLKYDYLIFKNEGIELNGWDDTMLISYALECGMHGHGMDELSVLHFDHKPIAFKEVAGTGKKQVTFDKVPLDKAVDYAAEDADITGRLYRVLKNRLATEGVKTVYETLDRPLVGVLANMEYEGIAVDRAMLNRLSMDFAERLGVLEVEIHELAGHPFNIASPKQLGEVLFDEMGLKGGKKSKTGAYSTNHEVLEGLAGEGHDLPARVLDWRSLAKLKSTYTDSLQEEINTKTNRIHTSYNLAGTSTGRLSSSDPNLQNIPIRTEEGRKIRKAFIATEGHKLVAADYSQIELRLLAHIAGIDALKDAFHEGKDIHAMTASEVFGVPLDQMTPEVRRQAKAINFGIVYGISAHGLARQLGISRKDAKDYIDAYFEKFPGIRHYMDETKEYAHEHGLVKTIFGRKCHIAALSGNNPMTKAFGERAAINAPIQGSAADVIRRAMIKMPSALSEAGLDKVRMLLQVHDELVFEVAEEQVDAAIPVIKATMENAALPALDISVPLLVDIGVGDNWDEAH
jgi:DNA polymerase-1